MTLVMGPRQMDLRGDGSDQSVVLPDGNTIAIKSDWKDDRFVMESQLGPITRITEEYEITEDGRRLQVNVQVINRELGISFRFERVYDRVATERP